MTCSTVLRKRASLLWLTWVMLSLVCPDAISISCGTSQALISTGSDEYCGLDRDDWLMICKSRKRRIRTNIHLTFPRSTNSSSWAIHPPLLFCLFLNPFSNILFHTPLDLFSISFPRLEISWNWESEEEGPQCKSLTPMLFLASF